jgi:uncharacterized repeat protein (TIGR04138 family)
MHKRPNVEDLLESICRTDTRYHRDAYQFVREALDHTQKQVARTRRTEPRHVTGQELLEGIRQFALDQFGPMAAVVLAEWGVHRCEDFGEIVFNMIEANLLGKTDKDSRADFASTYEFHDAFVKPFLPAEAAKAASEPESKTS